MVYFLFLFLRPFDACSQLSMSLRQLIELHFSSQAALQKWDDK